MEKDTTKKLKRSLYHHRKRNIALIGARGTGKSKLSQKLRDICERPILSTDNLLSYENEGLSISEIIKKMGWPIFRQLEHNVLQKLCKMKNIIIDCGGGIVIDVREIPKNDITKRKFKLEEIFSVEKTKLLSKYCYVVYLYRNISTLQLRNVKSVDRPPLFGDYKELLEKRLKYYSKITDFSINMDETSLEKGANSILKKYFK